MRRRVRAVLWTLRHPHEAAHHRAVRRANLAAIERGVRYTDDVERLMLTIDPHVPTLRTAEKIARAVVNEGWSLHR